MSYVEPYEGLLSLCKMEMEAIEEEGGIDQALLKIRMDTIYANLGIVRRSGYKSAKEKDQFKTLVAEFDLLLEFHVMWYDMDDLLYG